MERSLTLDELLRFMQKAKKKRFKAQDTIDEITGGTGFKLLQQVGRGSGETKIYAALDIHQTDIASYYSPFQDLEDINEFFEAIRVRREDCNSTKTNSRLVALKVVGKQRLAHKIKSIFTTSSQGKNKLKEGPGHIQGAKYLQIISSLMTIDNPYIAKYYPSQAIVTKPKNPNEGVIFLPMELLNFDFSEKEGGRNSLDLIYNILRSGDKELKERVMDEIPYIFARICFGLEKAYEISPESPIIHRDLKPGNIMFDFLTSSKELEEIDYYESLFDDDEWDLHERLESKLRRKENIIPKVIDFGIAKAVRTAKFTGTLMARGTGLYIPPETDLYLDCPITADVYQIGVMLMDVFVHNGDKESEIFYSKLQEKTKEVILELKKSEKDLSDIHDEEFDAIWLGDREEIAIRSNVLAKNYEKIRKEAIRKIVRELKVPGNELMTKTIRKAMAADPEQRYRCMAHLRYDIILSTKRDELYALEKRVTENPRDNDLLGLINEIGNVLSYLELIDETRVRTDYRNGKVLNKIKTKGLGEYFLEDNKWDCFYNIRSAYQKFKEVVERLLSKFTGKPGDLTEQVEAYKKILGYTDGQSGLNTVIKYIVQNKEAVLEDTPIRKIFQNIFDRQKRIAEREYAAFLKGVKAFKGELTEEQRIAIGTELDDLEWTESRFKRLVSGGQMLMAILNPKNVRKLASSNNVYYTVG